MKYISLESYRMHKKFQGFALMMLCTGACIYTTIGSFIAAPFVPFYFCYYFAALVLLIFFSYVFISMYIGYSISKKYIKDY